MAARFRNRRGRRGVRGIAVVAGVALTAAAIVSCAPPSGREAGSGGGTLTIGMHGNSNESLDPHTPVSAEAQEVRDAQLYEGLTKLSPSGKVEWDLAVGMHHNAALDVWTVKLRPNVTFQDGSAFGADDVIHSVKRILDPKRSAIGATIIPFVDPNGITKVDKHTVKFTLKRPFSLFKQVWTSPYLLMVPTGFNPKHPVGTGPFKFVSATPGRSSTFRRYDGYWGTKPKVTTLKLLDFPNRQAEIKALRGGQIDVAAQVPPEQADALGKNPGIKVLESKSNFHLTIGMRTDVPPFNDKRVRNAVRLLVDRHQVVKNAYSGHGSVANDMFVRSGDCVPDVPQRKQNIAVARKLLAEAGKPHLKFSIATADDEPGMLAMAQVIQQNAKRAGVTVTINKLDTAGFLAKWKQWPVAIGYGTEPYVFDIQESFLPGGGNNITHWDDKKFESLAHKLFTTADKNARCEIEKQMHAVQYQQGGNLIPAWADVLTAYRSSVSGLVKTTYLSPVYYLTGVSVSK